MGGRSGVPRSVSGVDGVQVDRLCRSLDPRQALFIVSSKSFTTAETLLNATTLLGWFRAAGLDAAGHWFAVTGNATAAERLGIARGNILDVPDWVGGRFSAWGAVGLPAALYLGWPLYERWLNGGAEMDEHHRTAALEHNLPVRLGLHNVWKYHYTPGLHENNTMGEVTFNLDVWNSLSPLHKEAVRSAIRDAFVTWTAKYQKENADALKEMIEDRQFISRENVMDVEHPDVGTYHMPTTPIKLPDQEYGVLPAPRTGQHTAVLLKEILEFDETRIAGLAEAGVIGVAE